MGDDWETPIEAWRELCHYLPKHAVLYDPFWCNGRSRIYLEDLGYKVAMHRDIVNCDRTTHGTCDCMNIEVEPFYDVLVTNPPFSQLEHIIPWLANKRCPVVVLLPEAVVQKEWFLDAVKDCEMHTYAPKKRINFINEGRQMFACKFDCVWVFLNTTLGPSTSKKRKYVMVEPELEPDPENVKSN